MCSAMYSFAKSLTMRAQVCEYCPKRCHRSITSVSRLHGIMACEEHIPLATRDVNAWLCEMKYVRQKDFLAVYPELAEMKFNVPRTDGSTTPGGNISQEGWQMLICDPESGDWRLPLLFVCDKDGEIKSKSLKISELGLPAEQLAAWTKTLDTFYEEDLAAHEEAEKTGKMQEPMEGSLIRMAYSDGKECRVLMPSALQS